MKKPKKSVSTKILLLVLIVAVVSIGIIFVPLANNSKKEFHEHVNFAVFINGVQFDFNQSAYMEDEENPDSRMVHMHDLNGGTIHIEAPGMTMGFFLKTIGFNLNSTCLVTDEGTYCNSGDRSLKMYVNGMKSNLYDKQEFHDLDKVLISFGNDSEQEIQKQINSVSSDACMHSRKCPIPEGFVDTEEMTCGTGEALICSE